jgi:hypothetical protein
VRRAGRHLHLHEFGGGVAERHSHFDMMDIPRVPSRVSRTGRVALAPIMP